MPKTWRVAPASSAGQKRYKFVIRDDDGKVLARSIKAYRSRRAARQAIEDCKNGEIVEVER